MGELDEELKAHKSEDYDPQFAEDVKNGFEEVHKDYYDMRLYMYKPQLTQLQVLKIIARAGILDVHGDTITQEQMLEHAADAHGPEIAREMSIALGHDPDKVGKPGKHCK